MSGFRTFVDVQMRLSLLFDRLFPRSWQIDGNRDFLDRIVPDHLESGIHLIDIGGGRTPALRPDQKRAHGARVTAIDSSETELKAAPEGSYDDMRVGDIVQIRGTGEGDLLICQALLEHVPDVEAAFEGLSSFLKPGGTALVFVPSRYAVYAFLNRLLPERWKKTLLFMIFPGSRESQGFPAWYDRCTPDQIGRLADCHGFDILERHLYFKNIYFAAWLPAHALWRGWLILFHAFAGDQAAETFTLVLRKRSEVGRAG